MGFKVFIRDRPHSDGRMPLIGEVDSWLSLEFTTRHNQVGNWRMLVRAGTVQERLSRPGCGVVIFQDGSADPVFSGTVDEFERHWTASEHTGPGSMYVGGKCDNQIPYSFLAFPGMQGQGDQAALYPLTDQWKGDDRRVVRAHTGKLIWTECDLAFGSRGVEGRQLPWVDVGFSSDPGSTVQDTLVFDNLGEKFAAWVKDKNTGCRFMYNPASQKVELKLYQVRNMSRTIRFSKKLGNIKEYSWQLSAPEVTRAIVVCQGHGKDRFIYQQVDDAAEAQWGFIAEKFLDRREIPLKTVRGFPDLIVRVDEHGNPDLGTGPDGKPWPGKTFDEQKTAATTYYLSVVKQAADDMLKEGQKIGHFQVFPIETPSCRFGTHYRVGDIVTVEADGQSLVEKIREVAVQVSEGDQDAQVAAKVGQQGAGEPLNLYKQVFDMMSRIKRLEAQI